jgi:hypothetical protein
MQNGTHSVLEDRICKSRQEEDDNSQNLENTISGGLEYHNSGISYNLEDSNDSHPKRHGRDMGTASHLLDITFEGCHLDKIISLGDSLVIRGEN